MSLTSHSIVRMYFFISVFLVFLVLAKGNSPSHCNKTIASSPNLCKKKDQLFETFSTEVIAFSLIALSIRVADSKSIASITLDFPTSI